MKACKDAGEENKRSGQMSRGEGKEIVLIRASKALRVMEKYVSFDSGNASSCVSNENKPKWK